MSPVSTRRDGRSRSPIRWRKSSRALHPRIVAIQKRVAQETGCGFFDTFQAMGGEGTMAHWYNDQPRLVSADFIHPTPAGARIIAVAFVKELVAGLNRYKLRVTGVR